MSEINVEQSTKPPAETDYFPRTPSAEFQNLKEIVGSRNVEVLPLGEVGYVVHNKEIPLIAEAPWILMDFDSKNATLTYDFDDRMKPGKNEFRLVVKDAVGNESQYKAVLIR